MKEILPNIFAIEVPEGTAGIEFRQSEFVNSTVSFYDQFTNKETLIELPGNCYHLFTTKDCTEEQAFEIAERQGGGWKDYDPDNNPPRYAFVSAVGSINSLLRSHGLDENKNYLLLKKIS